MGARRGSKVQKSAALFMYLSVVITGPICLFNGGNIIAVQSACVLVFVRDACDTVAVKRAGEMPQSCMELERWYSSKCLFTHTLTQP